MQRTPIKASLVRKMTIKDLRSTALLLQIDINHSDGYAKKKSHLLSDVLTLLRKQRDKADRIIITDEHRVVSDDKSLSKSECMRRLYDLDMPIKHIAIITNSHYSFVHGAIQRYLKKKEKSQSSIKEPKVNSIIKDDALASLSKNRKDVDQSIMELDTEIQTTSA